MGDLLKSVKISEAMDNLMDKVHQTPLKQSKTLNYLTNANVYLKLENLQRTGSFKLRGAMNKILSLSDEKASGILAASAGNHAQGVALAASLRGIKPKIYMPKHTPLSKVAATRGYGAETVLVGETYHESYQKAVEEMNQNGSTFVHAFDDELVIAGQGTVALEMLQQNSQLDIIFVPIGGGGLISGIALGVKAINPSIKVIGVQASGASATFHKFTGQKMKSLSPINTIADGILVKEPGIKTYPIIEKYVDEIVTVTDEEIAHAIIFMLEREKMLVEGAGAAALASILYKKVPIDRKNVGCIISGGNVDPVKIQTYKDLSKTTMELYYVG